MSDQMTPAEMREQAKRLRERVARHSSSGPHCQECSGMRAGADALDRLADLQAAYDELRDEYADYRSAMRERGDVIRHATTRGNIMTPPWVLDAISTLNDPVPKRGA
ncbi:MAG: hypothetical protein ACTH4Y_08215 [Microbacterium gubbeenense]|uniref:hypothetical protein n=1 Tax=Microbacterium gubbeenense TaxID=159896 RepID=UPI003F9DA493